MSTFTCETQEAVCEPTQKPTLFKRSVRISKKNYNDETIIEGIRQRDNYVLEYVYDSCYPMIKDMVRNHSGSTDDAPDIFQDAMVIIYNKVKHNDLVLYCSFKTYLYSVCKRLSLKYIENKRRESTLTFELPKPVDVLVDDAANAYEEEVEKYNIFRHHLLGLQEDARKLLKLYMENYSFKEISEIMGYKSENYAKTRKYAFKEELKRRIHDDPYFKKIYDACA